MPLAADMGRYSTDAPHDVEVFPHRPRNISLWQPASGELYGTRARRPELPCRSRAFPPPLPLADFLGYHDGVLPQLVD